MSVVRRSTRSARAARQNLAGDEFLEEFGNSSGNSRYRRVVFTLNNYTDQEFQDLKNFCRGCTWGVIGRECGEEKHTPHLQGMLFFCNFLLTLLGAMIFGSGQQFTLSALKKKPGWKRCHVQNMRGTPHQCLAYCTKEDKDAFQFGSLPEPGKRNDLHSVVERIQGGTSLKELAQDVEGGAVITKYHKGLTVLRSLLQPERRGAPYVFWFHGETGTGKTKCAISIAQRLVGGSDNVWISNGSLKWFDGYEGQPAVVVDDFRPKQLPDFNYAFLLRLLDRYPFRVEFKVCKFSFFIIY